MPSTSNCGPAYGCARWKWLVLMRSLVGDTSGRRISAGFFPPPRAAPTDSFTRFVWGVHPVVRVLRESAVGIGCEFCA